MPWQVVIQAMDRSGRPIHGKGEEITSPSLPLCLQAMEQAILRLTSPASGVSLADPTGPAMRIILLPAPTSTSSPPESPPAESPPPTTQPAKTGGRTSGSSSAKMPTGTEPRG